jgi:hypothetical protein
MPQTPQTPLSEHLPLAVAAAMTYHHLTAPQRPQFYDGEHLSEVLTRVAQALVQVARVYALDEATHERRALTDSEHAIVALKAKGFAVTRPS